MARRDVGVFALLGGLTGASGPLWAQTVPAPSTPTPAPAPTPRVEGGAEGGEAVVQAPSRRDEALLDTTRAVSRDSTASARRALARDVGERLDELPGVFVQRTTSASAAPLIRGLGGQRSLLLFDGIRLNDSLTKVGGNALLTLVDPSVIQRVEVLRGPASVMYGSDALGGVVQVVPIDGTPRADGGFGWRGEVMLRGASAERQVQSNAFVEAEFGRLGVFAGGSLGRTGTLTAGGDLGVQPNTGYDDRALSGRTVAHFGNHRVGFAFHTSSLFDAPRPDLSVANDRRVFREQTRNLGYVSYSYPGRVFSLQARAGAMQRDEIRDRFRESRVDTETDGVSTVFASVMATVRGGGARLSLGFDGSVDQVSSRTDTQRGAAAPTTARGRYIDGSGYLNSGLFAFYQQRLGARLLAEAGGRLAVVRVTAPSAADAAATDRAMVAPVGSLGLRWLLSDTVALMANGLAGFRAPNLDDFQALGSGARSFDVPNDRLGPERSYTGEVGLRVVSEGLSASVFGFVSYLNGLVVRVPSTYMGLTEFDMRRVYTRDNASEATMYGAEADVTWRHRTGLYASAAAMLTVGDTTFPDDAGNQVREPMAKVPPATGRLAVGWRHARGWVDAVLTGGLAQTRLASSDRDDVRICPNGPAACTQVDGWSTLSLRGGYLVTPWLTVGAAVENVTHNAYTPYGGGFPGPGLNVIGMLRLRAR
ncbi:MAG: TonB-dependent receptor [Myxococcales bacterium]|nr:TonB-dependent receptor [Myxococcales bacterium]